MHAAVGLVRTDPDGSAHYTISVTLDAEDLADVEERAGVDPDAFLRLAVEAGTEGLFYWRETNGDACPACGGKLNQDGHGPNWCEGVGAENGTANGTGFHAPEDAGERRDAPRK